MEKDTRIPPSCCLVCGSRFDAATGDLRAKGAAPKPGSLSVCIKCGAVAVFDDNLLIRPLTEEEELEIRNDQDLMTHLGRLVTSIHFVQAKRAQQN